MRFLRYLFILGIIIIFFGLFSTLKLKSTTGNLIITKEIKINDFLFFFGVSLTIILAVGEVESIKKGLEDRYKKKLPDVEVRFSDNIYGVRGVHPVSLPSKMPQEEKNKIYEQWNNDLKSNGLKDYELEGIDRSKLIIFIPRKYLDYPTILYGSYWEELGHEVAYAHNIENKIANEAVALAYRFKGLLQGAKQGKFTPKEAVDQIEFNIKQARSFPHSLDRHYDKALDIIRQYNPDLNFRDRDLDELIMELDKSVNYVFSASERVKWDIKKFVEKVKSILKK